ncbi:MAG TPA: hypothetical protein VKC60_13955, partial [Opitutaceae bacterium]|nr:hypothetical protein [Opitutaceae bacterium]
HAERAGISPVPLKKRVQRGGPTRPAAAFHGFDVRRRFDAAAGPRRPTSFRSLNSTDIYVVAVDKRNLLTRNFSFSL